MTSLRIHESRLPDLLDRWRSTAEVRAPRAELGGSVLRPSVPGQDVDLDFGNFLESPARLLLPDREALSEEDGSSGAGAGAEAPVVLFGVRPCDAAAVDLLDGLFSSSSPVDAAYRRRRRSCTIVTLACARPRTSCFCASVGGGPAEVRGSDLLAVPAGGDLLLEPVTPKGAGLLESAADLLSPAGPETVRIAEETVRGARERVALGGFRGPPGEPATVFGTEAWRELVESCRGCATCLLLCPTCHCVEVHQEPADGGGRSLRVRDSCARRLGAEPGGTPIERRERWWRRRMQHKFGTASASQGRSLCVGCGRCIRYCPAAIDIRSVLWGAAAVR